MTNLTITKYIVASFDLSHSTDEPISTTTLQQIGDGEIRGKMGAGTLELVNRSMRNISRLMFTFNDDDNFKYIVIKGETTYI